MTTLHRASPLAVALATAQGPTHATERSWSYTYNSRSLEISRAEASGTPQCSHHHDQMAPDIVLALTANNPGRFNYHQYDNRGRKLDSSLTGKSE